MQPCTNSGQLHTYNAAWITTGDGMAIICTSNSIYILTLLALLLYINKRTVGIWCDTAKSTIYYYYTCDSSCVGLLIVQWILSSITAGSPMVRTPTPLQLVVAGGSCSSVAEHWHEKPKILGLIPSSSTFLSCSFTIQRSTDSNCKIRSSIRPWLIGLQTW